MIKILRVFVIVLALVMGFGASGLLASQYLGEYCWTDEDGNIWKLAATDIGDGHFVVTGVVVEEGEDVILSGSGEIRGEDVKLTIVGSKDATYWTGGRICHGIVDLGSFDCTVKCVATGATGEENECCETKYFEKEMTFTECP